MQFTHRHDVFLSYAHKDEDEALELINLLEVRGVRVWWDRELIEKQRWSFTIEQALIDAKTVIVLWSPQSTQSTFVRDEARWGAKQTVAAHNKGWLDSAWFRGVSGALREGFSC